MEYRIAFTASKPLTQTAALCFWRRYTGWRVWLVWLVVAVCLSFSLLQGDRSWLVGVAATALVLLPGIWVCGYVTLVRRAWARLERMSNKTVECVLSEETVRVESALGKAEVPWQGVVSVWRFPTVWLLYFGAGSYVYLPAEQLDDSVKTFILKQATISKGRAE